MTKAEELFHQIATNTANAVEGKMFGALSIKAYNGKNAAFFLNDTITFKLDEKSQQKALKLEGASIGSHIYAPEKPMKGWVCIPYSHSDIWEEFAALAVVFVLDL